MMKDLGFAFNDKDFSDRILHLEVVSDSLDFDGSDSNKVKKKQKNGVSSSKDAASDNHSQCSSDVVVKTLYINSAILAGSSSFFYKLFKNGMKESQERDVTLRINASEEDALMDVLKFMYSNTLDAYSVRELLNVLTAADKYEVISCVRHCGQLLDEAPMSMKSAILSLEYPASNLVAGVLEPLIDAAKDYIVAHYGDVTEFIRSEAFKEEALALPLCAIEAILGNFQVRSEDDVYDFILRWGQKHLPKGKKRRETLTNLAAKYLYFPYLGMSTLREIQESPDFDRKQVSNLIIESLYLNSGPLYERRLAAPNGHAFIHRDHEYFPIKEVTCGSRHFVYLNLTPNDCELLYGAEDGRRSMVFLVGKERFFFVVAIEKEVDENDELVDENGADYFGLYVASSSGSERVFDLDLAVLTKEHYLPPSKGVFESKAKLENRTFPVHRRVGATDLLGMPWIHPMADRPCFCNGVMSLRAEFTVKGSN